MKNNQFSKYILTAFALIIALGTNAAERHIKIIETTDVHGCYFPYDFINQAPAKGSLARVHAYVDSLRSAMGSDNVVLLDDGDFLQGQPCAYYYNYIDTVSPHLASQVLNYMGYEAATIGNHDVETGHSVYDRWIAQNAFPTLGANVIDTSSGKPYLPPYTIIDKAGVRIAVLGMLTPAIPGWLPENLWSGLRFQDMIECAQQWVPLIEAQEKPDVMVGMFHAGRDSTKTTGDVIENASLMVAQRVPGIDIVLMGHDHSPFNQTIINDKGEKVVVINPANNAHKIAEIDLILAVDDISGTVTVKSIDGRLVSVDDLKLSEDYMTEFAPQAEEVQEFVGRTIGHIDAPLTTRDAYFGPSAFVDFIHQMQLDLTGADISMCAPLSFDATIPSGDIKVSDMFNLYKYENLLYTMELSGQEIKDYLEMSYDIWTSIMTSPDDHLLRLRRNANPEDMTHTGFQYPSYNFDSAAGILYTVDVTKPRGEKISILSMADGSPYDLNKKYQVAINSYRGNGGGNLLTQGAGIPSDELPRRIINSTDRDLRYYLIEYISERGNLDPKPLNQWRFIPEEVVAPAIERDRAILFPE